MANSSRVVVRFNHLPRIKDLAPQTVGAAFRELAVLGQDYAKESIRNSPASGRAYSRGGRTHIASSPGNPPRIDYGTLINSIHIEHPGEFRQIIVDGVEYGFELEFGNTRNLLPRPFFGPMALWLQTQIEPVFQKRLEKLETAT
jgi:hypothetical protein